VSVALGVAVIFQVSALAFWGLKILGAAYLLLLAWKSFRASAASLDDSEKQVLSHWALYRRGIIINGTYKS
jgi:threonine/homoserine/homoserine lactone efflux protein